MVLEHLEHKKAVIYGAGGAIVAEAAEVDALDEDAIEKHMDDAECPSAPSAEGVCPGQHSCGSIREDSGRAA